MKTQDVRSGSQHVKPDFLVVGAAKSGTTTLFHWLNQHPDIFLPDIKESRYFSQQSRDFVGLGAERYYNEGICTEEDHAELYRGQEHHCCGEVSTDYLYYHESSIQKLLKEVGSQVKIIMVLREPMDRAWSNYQHNVRERSENLDFESALRAESQRIDQHWAWPYHYMKAGCYHDAVRAYTNVFSQVKVLFYEDLRDPSILTAELFSFLNCGPVPIKSDSRHHQGGLPRLRFWHQCLGLPQRCAPRALKKIVRRVPIKPWIRKLERDNLRESLLPSDIRERWQSHFHDDILRLSELTGRNLNHWLGS